MIAVTGVCGPVLGEGRLEFVEPADWVNDFVFNVANPLGPVLVDKAGDDVRMWPSRVSGDAYGGDGVAWHDFLPVEVEQLVAVHDQAFAAKGAKMRAP